MSTIQVNCDLKKTEVVKAVKEAINKKGKKEKRKFTHREHNFAIKKLKPYDKENLATASYQYMRFSEDWIELLISLLSDKDDYEEFFADFDKPFNFDYKEALEKDNEVDMAFCLIENKETLYDRWEYLSDGFEYHKTIVSIMKENDLGSFLWNLKGVNYLFYDGCLYEVGYELRHGVYSETGFHGLNIEELDLELKIGIKENFGEQFYIYGVFSHYVILKRFNEQAVSLIKGLRKLINNQKGESAQKELDYKDYYYHLGKGEILLNEEQCEAIGEPIEKEETSTHALVDYRKNSRIDLYSRPSLQGKLIFKEDYVNEFPFNGVLIGRNINLPIINEDIIEELKDVDIEKLSPVKFMMFSGKLLPLYSIEELNNNEIFLYLDANLPDHLLDRDTILERTDIDIDTLPTGGYVIKKFPSIERIKRLYDVSELIGTNKMSIFSKKEFNAMRSFYIGTETDFYHFPKSWKVNVTEFTELGYCNKERVIELGKEAYKESPFYYVINENQIKEKHLIVKLRELQALRDILNSQNLKITSVEPLGITNDGRGVFELKKYKGYENIIPSIFEVFFASNRL